MSLFYLTGRTFPTQTFVLSASSTNSKYNRLDMTNGDPSIPFKFNTAAADDYFQAFLIPSSAFTFSSIHGHNLDSGVTAVELRKSTDNFVANDVLVATFPAHSSDIPSFYVTFASTSSQYWRVKFVGTNSSPISIGEWVLGNHSTLATSQLWGWEVDMMRHQVRTHSPDGQLFATDRSYARRRRLKLNFFGEQESDKDEIRDSILDITDWGEDLLIVVPDSNDEIVIHGRVTNTWKYKRVAGQNGGFYKYSLIVEEDPFELEFQ